jgi:hypothetical protein
MVNGNEIDAGCKAAGTLSAPPSGVIVGWQRREHWRKGPTPPGQGAWVDDLAINLGDQSEGTDETSPSWLDERPNSRALRFNS